ncbi:5051_t:CDS:2, partial [Scutellospora calospora]
TPRRRLSSIISLGWVTGTGGGISIRRGEHVYIAPSGVQKERMKPFDIFVLELSTRKVLRAPEIYRPSACTPLFYNAYTLRNAGIRRGSGKENLHYYDTLVVPIIDNTAEEEDLTDKMAQTIKDYPETNAILVRRHGVY